MTGMLQEIEEIDNLETAKLVIRYLYNVIKSIQPRDFDGTRMLHVNNSECLKDIIEANDNAETYNYIYLDDKDISSVTGHELLRGKGRLLVIGGQEIGINVMMGIAKGYGFEKRDFEFVDYDKSKGFAGRVRKDGRYAAVIFGACPHKTTGNNGFSSVVEKCRQIEGMPFATDARSKSGKLKVTKASFRQALEDVKNYLIDECAC